MHASQSVIPASPVQSRPPALDFPLMRWNLGHLVRLSHPEYEHGPLAFARRRAGAERPWEAAFKERPAEAGHAGAERLWEAAFKGRPAEAGHAGAERPQQAAAAVNTCRCVQREMSSGTSASTPIEVASSVVSPLKSGQRRAHWAAFSPATNSSCTTSNMASCSCLSARNSSPPTRIRAIVTARRVHRHPTGTIVFPPPSSAGAPPPWSPLGW
mmetsp:Transcript_25406/g.64459  ORF Transcript_25406/g.64459 Transcript_25406/m.64459 type:complete len:213 (+) Transcript_25406:308-946(+)